MRQLSNKQVLAIFLLAAINSPAPASAEQPLAIDQAVTVTTHRGKTVRGGRVDDRTSREHLWLRYGSAGGVIRRRLAWDEVRSLRQGSQEIARDSIQMRLLDHSRAPMPAAAITPRPDTPPPRADQQPEQRRVTQVHVDAYLANWDHDIETDGLRVHLQPADSRGVLQSVGGTLWVELLAEKRVRYHQVNDERGLALQRVAQWTVRVRRSDFEPSGVSVSLPFAAAHPELDSRWSHHGLVHVRYVAPGHGVFERSYDGVRIRPFAPTRDALELDRGRRFLPNERIGGRAVR